MFSLSEVMPYFQVGTACEVLDRRTPYTNFVTKCKHSTHLTKSTHHKLEN